MHLFGFYSSGNNLIGWFKLSMQTQERAGTNSKQEQEEWKLGKVSFLAVLNTLAHVVTFALAIAPHV